MANTSKEVTTKPKRRWLWIILSLLVLFTSAALVWEAEDTADVTRDNTPPALPKVSVLHVKPAEAVARLTAFAEVRPRWDAEIRAGVSGRITKVHTAALAGERVEAGTSLFSIERTQYEAAVAAAELRREEAGLALWQAENGVTLARAEHKRAGIDPPNELALRLPQLRIAERNVASAKAQLKAANRQLADSEVSAPFSGYVTRRMVSLGQTVTVGEALVHLSDDTHFELAVELSQSDWALLHHPIAGKMATLFRRDGTPLGTARIRSGGGYLDPQTRQRRLFLEVVDPNEDLLAGDFVRVAFAGRTTDGTLTIPESALSRAGYVWMVGDDDLLTRIEPDILFRTDGQLIIDVPKDSPPQTSDLWRVVVTPLASFLPGQRVAPQEREI